MRNFDTEVKNTYLNDPKLVHSQYCCEVILDKVSWKQNVFKWSKDVFSASDWPEHEFTGECLLGIEAPLVGLDRTGVFDSISTVRLLTISNTKELIIFKPKLIWIQWRTIAMENNRFFEGDTCWEASPHTGSIGTEIKSFLATQRYGVMEIYYIW